MPKLTYFAVHGRGVASRLILKHSGKEWVDQHPGQDGVAPWAELKAANPMRGGLPWYEDDNGKVFNQSNAILKALALDAGYKSDDPWVQYESEWVFEVIADFNAKDGSAAPFFKGAEATDEMREKSMECWTKMFDTLEDHFKDGRKYSAGAQITASDFKLLSMVVAMVENPHGKHPPFNQAVAAEYEKRANVKRVMETVKSENNLLVYIEELYAKKWAF